MTEAEHIAALQAGNAAELAAYDDTVDTDLQFCFEPPDYWPHCELPWGSSPTLSALLVRRPDLRDLKLSCVWCGTNLIWGFIGDGPWKDAS